MTDINPFPSYFHNLRRKMDNLYQTFIINTNLKILIQRNLYPKLQECVQNGLQLKSIVDKYIL